MHHGMPLENSILHHFMNQVASCSPHVVQSTPVIASSLRTVSPISLSVVRVIEEIVDRNISDCLRPQS
jgi:hypothetical protein